MKCLQLAILALLVLNAVGARRNSLAITSANRGRLGSKCGNVTKHKELAVATAKDRLASLKARNSTVSATLTNLMKEITAMAANVSDAEKAQAAATAIRQKEAARFLAETKEVTELLDALKKATVAIPKASPHQPGSGAVAAVRRVMKALSAFPPAKAQDASVLEAFATSHAGHGPEPAAVRRVLDDMSGAFGKELESAAKADDDKKQKFEAFVTEKQAELRRMKGISERKEFARRDSEALLANITQTYAQREAELQGKTALLKKVKALCAAEKDLVLSNSSIRAATSGKPLQFQAPDANELARMKKYMADTLAKFSVVGDLAMAPPGTYSMVAETDVAIPHLRRNWTASSCSSPFKGNIYYPEAKPGGPAPGPGPIISFAHGFTEGAGVTDHKYRTMLFRPLVSMGYVVVAHQSGGLLDYCDSSYDQRKIINWALETHASKINADKAVLMGFSMGGKATLKNAANSRVTSYYNVVAAVVFMPHCTFGCDVPVVPTHFFTGTADTIAPPDFTRQAYDGMQHDRLYSLKTDMTHMSPFGDFDLTRDALTWLTCVVSGASTACSTAQERADSYCSGGTCHDDLEGL